MSSIALLLKISVIILVLNNFNLSNETLTKTNFKKILPKSDNKSISVENLLLKRRVLVAIQIQNHSYALSTFLGVLENLKCFDNLQCDLL